MKEQCLEDSRVDVSAYEDQLEDEMVRKEQHLEDSRVDVNAYEDQPDKCDYM